MTMCYGKCYLKKQIEDTKDQQEESGFQIHELPVMQLPELPLLDLVAVSFPQEKNKTLYTKSYFFLNQQDIFHPPRTI